MVGKRRVAIRSVGGTGFVAAALVVVLMVARVEALAGGGSLYDASADRVLATTVIPDAARKVGEVRLVVRGDVVVVQTLLSTKLLSRVIAEIRKKEETNWSPADASVSDYVAALDAARETVEKREPTVAWDDRRRRLLIEFAADSREAAVLVGTFRFAKDGSDTMPHDRELFATLALPRAYVLRNMRLILADAFKVPEQDVDRLGPLGPAASTSTEPQPPVRIAPSLSAPAGAASSAPAEAEP